MAVRESEARRSEIVRLARSSGLASVEELSAQFGLTPSTIRRDLSQLTSQGLIARTYGGAIRPGPQQESAMRRRATEWMRSQPTAARWGRRQGGPGGTPLLDA